MEPGEQCDTVLNFQQHRKLVWVEYPGVVKNIGKVIETLGGIKNISTTYNEPKKRIDLRFRPDDPCCHPVCGDRTNAMALLLRVRKYRKKKTDPSAPDEFRYIPEITGYVETGYQFNSLCDFQYLPLYNDTKTGELINMIPHLKVTDLDESIYTRDVPLFLPPPTFSRFDQPQDVLFRKDPKYKNPGSMQMETIGVTRPRRAHYAQYIKYEESWTPKEPLPIAKQLLDKTVTDQSTTELVKNLFEERPIWSKNAIVCRIKCPGERLKLILPTVAYYFITGPWRSLWVKFGYDPRKEPEAVKYQLLDFRVRQGLNTPNIPIKAKRSTLSYRLPNLMPRTKRLSNFPVSNLDKHTPVPQTPLRSYNDSVYVYRRGVLPAYRQTFYQVCDIEHEKVVELLKTYFDDTGHGRTCNSKSGWLPEDMASKIRDILSNDIQATLLASQDDDGPSLGDEKRTKSSTRKVQDIKANKEKDESYHARNELVESMLGLGMPPESSDEEEEESDVDEDTAEILDSLLEDVEDPQMGEDAAGESRSTEPDNDPLKFIGDYDEDLDDLDDIMEGFEALAPDNLMDDYTEEDQEAE